MSMSHAGPGRCAFLATACLALGACLAAASPVERPSKRGPHVSAAVGRGELGTWDISFGASGGGIRAAARGTFVDARDAPSNWGQLWIKTSSNYTDREQMYAAGYLEGYLTADRIYDHHYNMKAFFNITTDGPSTWLLEQDSWVKAQVKVNGSKYWATLGLILAQHEGMAAGYSASVDARQISSEVGPPLPHLTWSDFLLLSAVGDLGDLVPALDPTRQVAWAGLAPGELEARLAAVGRCSALVRVDGNFSNLLLAHSSWFTYSGMVRIFKHYDFALCGASIRGGRMSFASYPGELSSDDDFYLMGSGLAVLQTTNNILNTSLYEALTPYSVVNWQRVRLANALAESGREWADIISAHNSGTYNNQYMVVDLNRFVPGEELREGLLWVVEQIPGLVVAADQTATLERGYWPSYNVPFYPEIYRRSGWASLVKELRSKGATVPGASYQLAPRAAIFRRDVGTVVDLLSLRTFMRSNNFSSDPYSRGSSLNAICGRGDLDPARPRASGCYDTCVTDWAMAKRLAALGVNGPPGTAEGLPPFRWSTAAEGIRHAAHHGQPDLFDFVFEELSPAVEPSRALASWAAAPQPVIRDALSIE